MYLGKVSPSKSPYKIIIAFAVIAFLVIGFVLYTSFSKAEIVLTPRMEKISTEFNINIGKDKASATAVNGRFIQKEFEDSAELADIPDKKVDDFARGKVTVHNKLERKLTVVANSQIKPANSDIIFKTQQALILPKGGKQQIDIIATKKGVAGNLKPTKFTFVKLWPGWANLVYAENKDKLKGGEKTGKVVSEQEMNDLKSKLEQKLFDQGIKELEGELEENEELWAETFKKEIVDFKPSVNIGQESENLTANMKLKLTGVLLNKEMLENLALAKLKGRIIDGKKFVGIDDESFSAEILEMDFKKKRAEFKINLNGNIHAELVDALDKEKIIGLNKEELDKYYQKYRKEIENVDVSFSPFWQKTVPSTMDHVEIIIDE